MSDPLGFHKDDDSKPVPFPVDRAMLQVFLSVFLCFCISNATPDFFFFNGLLVLLLSAFCC